MVDGARYEDGVAVMHAGEEYVEVEVKRNEARAKSKAEDEAKRKATRRVEEALKKDGGKSLGLKRSPKTFRVR
ncbi:hypothetical protein [Thermofilum pendens]|uniref:hypothetical protein n=1 Tax=Thermofilum pendens TaxID=2269 RepID=UPI000325E602|nr:hypothetical protein [Thermofilum pendens]